MAVKMPRISTQALSGPATISKARDKQTGDAYWIINMRVWDSKIKDYQAIEKFKVAVGKAPVYLKSGDWSLRVAADKTQILSGLPDSAVLVCEFAEFLHEENKAPAPTVSASTFDASKPWIKFAIKYKVVEGDFKGLDVVEYLNYNFGPYRPPENEGRVVAAYKPAAGKSTEALAQRIDALRILEYGYIPWKGEPITWTVGGQQMDTALVNILPILEQRARKAVEELNARLLVTVVGGKVAQVKPYIGDGEEVWDEDETETVSAPAATLDGDTIPAASETLPDGDEISWDDEE